MADWQDSLFDEDKGDSLGDGTWGRRTTDEPALAPVDWSALEGKAEVKKQPVRTRLATPAPGSQKGSGLLDIRALAAEMKKDKVEPAAAAAAAPKKHATGEQRAARLATDAKASTGSGLINVADIVRQQEQEEAQAKASASGSGEGRIDDTPVSPAASSSFAASSLEAPMASQSVAAEVVAPAGHNPMLMLVLGVLTLAVVGLAIYVLTS